MRTPEQWEQTYLRELARMRRARKRMKTMLMLVAFICFMAGGSMGLLLGGMLSAAGRADDHAELKAHWPERVFEN